LDTVDTLPAAQAHQGASAENSTPPAQASKTSLTQHEVNELAHWFFEDGDQRRIGLDLDRDALDRDLRSLIARYGVPPQAIATEFERIMVAVFAPSPWLTKVIAARDLSPGASPTASGPRPHEYELDHRQHHTR
jgi:hypothetical protein